VARLLGGSVIMSWPGTVCDTGFVPGLTSVRLISVGGLGCIHAHSVVITCVQRVCGGPF